MAYDLHIERMGDRLDSEPIPIPLEEWCAAVAATSSVRLYPGEAYSVTTDTGEVISFRAHKGDSEVFFPDSGEWRSVFRWREDSAVFVAEIRPGDITHPVWAAAVALASRLNAVIRGDEGEVYDLRTGEVVDA